MTVTEHITSVVDNTYRMLFLEMQRWRKVVRGTGSQVWDEPKTLRRAFPVPEIPSDTLKIGFTFFYNGYFSVSTLVFINSFQMQISLSLRMTRVGEEFGTGAFIFSFLAALKAVYPKPKPAHGEL